MVKNDVGIIDSFLVKKANVEFFLCKESKPFLRTLFVAYKFITILATASRWK